MTGRERVLAAMRHRVPDRVPFDFTHGLTAPRLAKFKSETGHNDPNEYFGGDARQVRILPSRHPLDHRSYYQEILPGTFIDEWGMGHVPSSSENPDHAHLEGYLYSMRGLRGVKEVRDYPFPDVDAEYRFATVADQAGRIKARGWAVLSDIDQTSIFEQAWYLRSMEQLFVDFVDHPDLAETLLDRITAVREMQSRMFAERGVDILLMGDDVGTQQGMLMSVSMWRRWLKPRLARLIRAAKQGRPQVLTWYHSDGNIRAIVPDLIEIGVDILNPVQPECLDPAELKRAYGDRISFWGSIGTQRTLPFGTPQEVRQEVITRLASCAGGGGLLIAPTHIVEPEVPLENLVAMVETVKEFGLYREDGSVFAVGVTRQ